MNHYAARDGGSIDEYWANLVVHMGMYNATYAATSSATEDEMYRDSATYKSTLSTYWGTENATHMATRVTTQDAKRAYLERYR